MAKLVYALNQSLDGYIDHMAFRPSEAVFQHFVASFAHTIGMIYGRGMYEVMRYWDTALPEWDAGDHEFAAAWRSRPKWIASRTMTEVGPNATLLGEDVVAAVRALKETHSGEISVAGHRIAQTLGEAGLIDEYQMYLHPVVLGKGTPYFAGALPRLKFLDSEQIDEDVIRLRYVPV